MPDGRVVAQDHGEVRLGQRGRIGDPDGQLHADVVRPADHERREPAREALHDDGVRLVLRAHAREHPVEQLHGLVLAEDPQLDHPHGLVRGDRADRAVPDRERHGPDGRRGHVTAPAGR
jgi:hypothetical protein